MVFATATRLLGNRSEAEDIAQAVFLRAFQRFGELHDNPAAAGWLKTVTRNACLNNLSRYRSRWMLFSEAATVGDAPTFDPPAAHDTSPAFQLERADQHAHLEQALEQLPDAQRIPLVLFHFEELSYQEIAAVLGVSLAKVKTDIHRGRETLRRTLGDRR